MYEEPRARDVTLEPLDDYLVIYPSDGDSETRNGLILPISAETKCRTGIVTAVGADVNGIEPGDKVLFPKEAGFDVRVAGVEAKVVRRNELVAKVHD